MKNKQVTAIVSPELKGIIIAAMVSGIHEILESSQQIINNAGQIPDKTEKPALEF